MRRMNRTENRFDSHSVRYGYPGHIIFLSSPRRYYYYNQQRHTPNYTDVEVCVCARAHAYTRSSQRTFICNETIDRSEFQPSNVSKPSFDDAEAETDTNTTEIMVYWR